MNDLVKMVDGQAMANSKEVGDHFGKKHFQVLRDIRAMDCSDEFRAYNFVASSYVTSQNKKVKCVNITRDGFAFLGMGFNGPKAAKFKEDYIVAFNKMELALRTGVPVMDDLNQIAKQVQLDSKCSSEAGRLLRSYRGVNKANKLLYEEAEKAVQLALGF